MDLHDFRLPDAGRYRNVPEAQILGFLCSPFELAAGRAEPELAAMQVLLDRLVATGLPFRPDAQDTRRFDLAEVVNFIKHAHYAWENPVWLKRSVANMRRICQPPGSGDVPDLPADPSQGEPQRIAVTITRRFMPGFLRSGSSLRLNMPKPLNAYPGSLKVDWLRCDGAIQPPSDEGSRHCVKVMPQPGAEVVIALRQEFIPGASHTPGESDGQPAEPYLRPREGLVGITPQVAVIAARLGLRADDPWWSLQRIWDYLFDEISFGFIQYDRLDAGDPLAWGLEHRRFDCRTGGALIVALCRAAGIPARMINGYTLNPIVPTTHSWVEVWMGDDGWVPFDTYAIDLAGGKRDSPWRAHYFGRIDPRFAAEVLPLHFCGLGSARLPPSWQLSLGITTAGAITSFHAVEGFAPLYSETVSVEAL